MSAATFTGAGQSTTDVTVAAQLLGPQQIILADALDALVTSLERHDGALAAGDSDALQSQADAVRQNAAAARAAQLAIVDLATTLNGAWQQAQIDLSLVTVAALKSSYTAAVGSPQQAPKPVCSQRWIV